MKSKNVLGLAIALTAVALCGTAQAQIGGSAAQGDAYTSTSNSGNMGQDTDLNTGKQAFKLYRSDVQNYVSPNTPDPSANDHSSKNYPQVRFMKEAGPGGLNQVSTATMAQGSVDMSAFPSGSFNYGFKNAQAQPYMGAYARGGPQGNMQMGNMLPNTSLGSVDFNTVDTSGIAPVGMISPGNFASSPITRPIMQMPNNTSSTSSVLNWLQNSFFGN